MRASFIRHLVLRSVLAIAVFAKSVSCLAAPASTPDFELPRWKTGELVKLSDFSGQIVVLDFFAYWCVPCKRASTEIENGIQRYYAMKKGNPHGIPVRVIAVNIERDNPKFTAQFVEATGSEFVLNDFDGVVLEKFDGVATPFLVVIDGSRATKETPEFRVLYKNAGFEGTRKLRHVIDGIQPPKLTSLKESADQAAGTGLPKIHKGGVAFDTMLASDVKLTSTTATYGQQQGGTEWNVRLTYNTIEEDYQPFRAFDFETLPRVLHENYLAGQASVRQKLSDALTVLGAGGVYDGFTDYRSLWFSEYYRQRFIIDPIYFPSDPQGFNASTGLRWEYQPTTGFVEAGFLYAYDQIPPGWDRPSGTPENPAPELEHGREILHTYSPSLKFENVLTRRIRALNEFQLTLTTGREPRYAYRGSVNVALGERWVWRVSGGYAHEDPTLRAWNVGATLEYEITPRWLASVSGLYYHDTGEIENSSLISTASPGLQTFQGGLGLRYVGGRSSLSLSVSPMWSDYEPLEVGTRPLTNLYRDRSWILVQAAWSFEI